MTRPEVISAVMARLDELTPFQENDVALDVETLAKPVEQYVEDFLDEATDTVRLLCPERRMTSADLPKEEDGEDEEGNPITVSLLKEEKLGNSDIVYYTLPLPSDFLKIAEVRMGNWDRSCFSAAAADGEAYRILRNPYTTAGPAKPAVVVSSGLLEFYGSRVSGITLFTGQYIDNRHYGENENAMAQSELVDSAIIWRCALLVLGAMGRSEVVKQAEAFYIEAIRVMS
jgi:hypothetical protein